jgi:hypothetical protein
MSLKPNPKEINIISNILKVAQFEFLPRAPFYIDTPLLYRFTFLICTWHPRVKKAPRSGFVMLMGEERT